MAKYQRAYFPMKEIRIVQGHGKGASTHRYSLAIDMNGKGAKTIENIYAPFDCKVSKLYQPSNTKDHANTVWLTSTCKVLCVNGYYGYLTMSITHPAGISKMRIGQKFKQGELILKEGATGKAEAPHAHIELAKGTKAGWHKTHGSWVIDNAVPPEDYLFLREDAVIYPNDFNGQLGKMVKESDITYKVVNVSDPPLLIRTLAFVKIGELHNGDEVIKFDNNKRCKVYHYGVLGYTYSKYLKKK